MFKFLINSAFGTIWAVLLALKLPLESNWKDFSQINYIHCLLRLGKGGYKYKCIFIGYLTFPSDNRVKSIFHNERFRDYFILQNMKYTINITVMNEIKGAQVSVRSRLNWEFPGVVDRSRTKIREDFWITEKALLDTMLNGHLNCVSRSEIQMLTQRG